MELVLWFTLLLSLCFFHVAATANTHHLCLHEERAALWNFKQSFTIKRYGTSPDANYHQTDSWKLGGDCCRSWDGVECDEINGHVTGLDLSSTSYSTYLYGSISSNSSLFQLLHLKKLNLANNDFSYSQIPSKIGLLSSLTYLNLSRSLFSGQIPSALLLLSNMTSLDLNNPSSDLKLERPNLKDLVHNLTKLEHLDLSLVNMSYSKVPNALANYSSLKSLILYRCKLHGNFLADVFHLPRLHILDLSFNPSLTGYLPPFHSSSNLEELYLVSSNFMGDIPASIGNLASLKVLNLGYNNFSGWLPPSLGRLTNLTYLSLSGNNFMGLNSSSSFSWLLNLPKLTRLGLARLEIRGEIPSQIAGLSALDHLYLFNNEFSGEVPAWLANLTQLVVLDLGENRFTGGIPSSLSSLTKLENLWLEHNKLTGPIPFVVTNFTQLRDLFLSFNRFEGPFPDSFSNLKKLQCLDLFSNNLNGTVELDMFHKLKELSVLHLSQNNLSLLIKDDIDTHSVIPDKYKFLGLGSCNLSQFPTFLRNQNQLMWLDLSSNNIHGGIPKWIWNISTETLDSLNISHNLLTSFEDHPKVLPWTTLRTLDIRFNALQGSLPMPPLSTNFYLASNNLWDAHLSPVFCSLSNLVALDISNNKLSGMLPRCLGSGLSKYLRILNLQNNNFGGTIPESWVDGCALKMINLSQNQFHGKVPASLCNCTMLEFVDFGENHIRDTFPAWLGGLSELRVLIMRSNMFHGVIQKREINDSEFTQLRIMDVSFNSFSGKLSTMLFETMNSMKVLDDEMTYMETILIWEMYWSDSHVGYYDYSMKITNKGMERIYSKIPNIFTGIDLSNNHFEGEIPTSIGNLKGLHLLSLGNNNFTGSIPSTFGNLQQLESLDLSHNKLSGKIPRQLVQLTFLSFFNVSFNNLSGPIPHGGQFDTFQNSSYEGNPLLLPPLSPPPSKSTEEPEDSEVVFGKIEWMVILIGFGGGMVVGVLLGNEFWARKPYWFVKLFGSTRMFKWLGW